MIASLLEGALVNCLGKEDTDKTTSLVCCTRNTRGASNAGQCLLKSSILHKVSRILFPMAFVVFNVGYWVCFMKGK